MNFSSKIEDRAVLKASIWVSSSVLLLRNRFANHDVAAAISSRMRVLDQLELIRTLKNAVAAMDTQQAVWSNGSDFLWLWTIDIYWYMSAKHQNQTMIMYG